MVDERAVPFGGEEPKRDTEDDREEHRRERELNGRGEPVPQLLGHGTARGDAVAEIAFQRRLHVLLVLDEDRLIETVLVPEPFDRRGRRPLA